MDRTLKNIAVSNKEHLIYALMEANYAFAIWRMPYENAKQFIISLKEPTPISSNINDLDPGFIINSYRKNHPIKPIFINADVIVNEKSVDIDPRVNDSSIDSFSRQIEKPLEETIASGNEPTSMAHEQNPIIFQELVQNAIERIKNGCFEKVVLSRFKEDVLDESFSAWQFYQHIEQSYPGAFCSMTYIPNHGLWTGASPELLVSGNAKSFRTVSLAGTKRLMQGQDLSQIAWTQKEIEEQALVSRYIINCFKKLRLREFHEHGPKTVKAGNLAHLKTDFEVNLNEVQFENLMDQMIELLHPTSAVCGMPIEKAQPWIEQNENYDREFYAGFLGPVNYQNSTDLFVNLRCAKLANGLIRFYAGAGITEDSNPEKELEETEMKIEVLRHILKQS